MAAMYFILKRSRGLISGNIQISRFQIPPADPGSHRRADDRKQEHQQDDHFEPSLHDDVQDEDVLCEDAGAECLRDEDAQHAANQCVE